MVDITDRQPPKRPFLRGGGGTGGLKVGNGGKGAVGVGSAGLMTGSIVRTGSAGGAAGLKLGSCTGCILIHYILLLGLDSALSINNTYA